VDTSPTTVAIFNASDDALDVFVEHLSSADHRVVRACIRSFRTGQSDLSAFMAEHNPGVVVWDVSCPYYVNWLYLQDVRTTPDFAGRVVIVTAPNVARLNDAVGAAVPGAIELVGNPHDMDLLLKSVRHACESLAPAVGSAAHD
jgi:DNA-binding NtrC family response regulator